ncbi:MAG: M20/M25/M40 family metallo-hydrolase, partial [Myxococcota bacterium]
MRGWTLALLWWGLWFVLGVHSLRPPAAKPMNSDMGQFSAARAFRHVETLASANRTVGTRHHGRSRRYIAAEMGALGWVIRLQPALYPMGAFAGQYVQLTNLEARLLRPGPEILVSAHYDSVATGPGAGDDAAGVAAMIEVARILSARPDPPAVRMVFTDAEELGLLGMKAYAAQDGIFDNVRAAINIEGRGARGPSLLFETSPNNQDLIDAFAQAPVPVGNSTAYEVYRNLPNDTDFSVLRDAGVPGVNFSFIGGFLHYHTAIDTPENLSVRSLQHHGEMILSMIDGLSSGDLDEDAPNVVFFSLPGGLVGRYPSVLALPLAIVALLLTIGACIHQKRSAKD